MKSPIFKFFILTSLMIWGSQLSQAQIVTVGGNSVCYLQGSYTEVAVADCGVYGDRGTVGPTGYNFNVGSYEGWVCDAAKDGWTTGTPTRCGDYYMPGSPTEGWAIEFNGTTYYNHTRCGTTGAGTGTLSNYTSTSFEESVVFTITVASRARVRIQTVFDPDSLYFIGRGSITNVGTTSLDSLFLLRMVDPDQDQPHGGGFSTHNRIMSQPTALTDMAYVRAIGNSPGCYLGLGAIDARARVNIAGSWFATPSDYYEATGGSAFTGTTGDSNYQDAAVGVSFFFDDLAVGDSVEFCYAYVLTDQQIEWACGCPDKNRIGMEVNKTDVTSSKEYRICFGDTVALAPTGIGGYTWSWTPTTYTYGGTSDSMLTARPLDTITYTIVGIGDTSIHGQCDTVQFSARINVQDSMAIDAMADTTVCDTSNAFLRTIGSTGTPLPYGAICGAQGLIGSGTGSTHTAGSGTSSIGAEGPFYGFAQDQRVQYLIRAAELGSMDTGLIEGLQFYVNSKLSSNPYKGFTVKIGCTSLTSLSTTGGWVTGLDVVKNAHSLSTTSGWNNIVFDRTYTWDGSSNLVVEICWDNTSTGFYDLVRYTTTTYNSVIYRTGTGTGCSFTTPSTQSSSRPNIRFNWKDFPTVRAWSYCWSPGAGLDDSTSATPIAAPTATPTWYYVTIKAGECIAYDSVFVDIDPCTTLPIELLHFDAQKVNNAGHLSWTTASEINVSHFEIQRSTDALNWEKIGEVAAAGNSSNPIDYEYYDIHPKVGKNYYRLKIIDQDGSYQYSPAKYLTFQESTGQIGVYPNPLKSGDLYIDLSQVVISNDEALRLNIYDAMGKKVYGFNEKLNGRESLQLNIDDLSAAMYIVVIENGNQVFETKLMVER